MSIRLIGWEDPSGTSAKYRGFFRELHTKVTKRLDTQREIGYYNTVIQVAMRQQRWLIKVPAKLTAKASQWMS